MTVVSLFPDTLYGADQVTYQVNWLKCARDYHGIAIDWRRHARTGL